MALGFDIHTTDGVPWSVEFATDSPKIAGVVVGDRSVVLGLWEFALDLKMVDELRMVHDLNVFTAVVLVLLSKRVEAVRAEATIFLTPISSNVERLVSASIWNRYSLPARRAASPLHPSCIPRIPTSRPGLFHDADGVSGDLLVALVKRGCAAGEVDVFGGLCHLHVKAFCPIATLVGGPAVGVGIRFKILNGGHERHDRVFDALVELHAFHHEMAASVGEFGDMVNVNRACLNAGVAGGARPNGVFTKAGDDVFFRRFTGKDAGGVVVGVMADVVNDLHRVEGFAAGVSRADILTASARRACPSVDKVSPVKSV